ncbi:MAG: cysteine desulfurase family protein [Mariprofundales bacterium]
MNNNHGRVFYMDYNATALPVAAALNAMQQVYQNTPGNPSAVHWSGRAARCVLDDAREKIAAYVHAPAASLVFTSGGTEANNMIISGWLGHLSNQANDKRRTILLSDIEHASVRQAVLSWQKKGWNIVRLRPDSNGVVQSDTIAQHLDADTCLVCVMYANNETGVLQPVNKISELCRANDVPLLVDAVQALGKTPLDMRVLQADFVTFSAHKIGGPKGIGASLVRRERKLEALLAGGGQERGRRSGTENVAAAAGFAAAIGEIDFSSTKNIRDKFEQELCKVLPDVEIHGQDADRVSNTSMFYLPQIEGETMLMQLDLAGFALSAGSACSSGKQQSSYVLHAMGVPEYKARASLRVSFGAEHTVDDVMQLVQQLHRIRSRLQRMAGFGR